MAPLSPRRDGAKAEASSPSRASSRMSSRMVWGTPRCDTTERKLEFHILLDRGSLPEAKLACGAPAPAAGRTPRHRGTAALGDGGTSLRGMPWAAPLSCTTGVGMLVCA